MQRNTIVVLLVAAALAVAAYSSLGPPADIGGSAPELSAGQEGSVAEPGPGRAPGAGTDEVPAERRTDATRLPGEPEQPGHDARPRSTVLGRVVDGRGRPILGAKVSWSDRGDRRAILRDAERIFEEAGGRLDDLAKLRDRFTRAGRAGGETGAGGRFRIEVPAGTASRLRVEARGFASAWQDVTAKAGEATDVGDIALTQGVLLSGRVVDSSGRGVPGARVAESDPTKSRMLQLAPRSLHRFAPGEETGENGEFEVLLDEPGDYSLVVMHEHHPDARHEGTAARTGEISGIVIRLEDGGTIEGTIGGIPEGADEVRVTASRVEEPNTAKPDSDNPFEAMLGATLSGVFDQLGMIGERVADVAADGTFRLEGLAPGEHYQVWGVHGDGVFDGQSCTEAVRASCGAKSVRLVYAPGAHVTFQVVDAETGEPLADYDVEVGLERKIDLGIVSTPITNMRSVGVEPDAEGRVRVGGLRPKEDHGVLTVRVQAAGYEKLEKKDLRIPRQGATDLGVFRLRRAATVHVRVLAADGQPVQGARVTLGSEDAAPDAGGAMIRREVRFGGRRGGPRSGRPAAARIDRGETDEDGRCTLHAAQGSQVRVLVSAGEFAPYRGDVFRLTGAGPFEREARLTKGGTVVVTVVGAQNRPAAGVAVERRGPNDEPGPRVETGADGKATFAFLAPGEHRFRVTRSRGAFAFDFRFGRSQREQSWKRAVVIADQTVEVSLQKPGEAAVTGLVTENGVALAGARVRFLKGRPEGSIPDGSEYLEAALGSFADRLGGGRGSAKTDDKGYYRLEGVEPGAHRLRVSHESLNLPKTFDVTLVAGDNTQNLVLSTAAVSGRVVDQGGEPVARARIQVSKRRAAPSGAGSEAALAEAAMGEVGEMLGLRRSGEIRSGADGRYSVRGVPTGVPIVVSVRTKKHVPATSEAFTLRAGQSRTGLDFRLMAGGSIRVEVQDAPMLAAITATPDGKENARPRVAMLEDGSATLSGLAPGTWKVELREGEGDAKRRETVQVVAGETVRVRL